MRWEALLADLSAQAEALERAERAGEVSERTRAELSGVGLVDRLRAAVEGPAQLTLLGGVTVAGGVSAVSAEWVLLAGDANAEWLVPVSAISVVRGLGRATAVPGSAGVVEARFGLRAMLRGI